MITFLRYVRVAICLLFIWIWTALWGIGLTLAFLFLGHKRGFLPYAVRILSIPILWVCGIRVEVRNKEGMYKVQPCLYMTNHQSGFDVTTFGQMCPPNLVWIAKKELGSLPLIGWVLKRTGNILIDRKNRHTAIKQLEEAGKRLTQEKLSVVVLPEGTRNKGEALLPFKRGPFYLATAARVDIVPAISSSLRKVANIKKGLLGGKVIIEILEPVHVTGTPEELSEKIYKLMQATFEKLNAEL